MGMLQGGLTWPASISVWFEHPDPASIDSFLIYRKIGDGSFAPVKVKTLQPAAGTGNPKGGEPGDVPPPPGSVDVPFDSGLLEPNWFYVTAMDEGRESRPSEIISLVPLDVASDWGRIAVTSPLDYDTLSTARPTLAYQPYPGAESYVVWLFQPAESGRKSLYLGRTGATELPLAPDSSSMYYYYYRMEVDSLPPGTYWWTLFGIGADGISVASGGVEFEIAY
ncbi:MAG TPA: hypothetical protein PKY95_09885 [candidate division Zixibacteria bacterium]|nr:hypothetical protein [candidate division Zixibacteria bacterium]